MINDKKKTEYIILNRKQVDFQQNEITRVKIIVLSDYLLLITYLGSTLIQTNDIELES